MPPYMLSFLIITIPYPNGIFVTINKPTSVNHHPKFIVYITDPSRCGIVYEFGNNATYPQSTNYAVVYPDYSIIQTSFTDSKILCVLTIHPSVQFSSVAQLCLTFCDPMNRSTPGLPVHHQLPQFTQTHIHRVRDAIQPSHPQSSPFPPAPNPSQHQSLFQ